MAPEPDRNGTDDTLMRALACGATVAVAARQAGLSERTAYRRLAEPGFRHGVAGGRIAACCVGQGCVRA